MRKTYKFHLIKKRKKKEPFVTCINLFEKTKEETQAGNTDEVDGRNEGNGKGREGMRERWSRKRERRMC